MNLELNISTDTHDVFFDSRDPLKNFDFVESYGPDVFLIADPHIDVSRKSGGPRDFVDFISRLQTRNPHIQVLLGDMEEDLAALDFCCPKLIFSILSGLWKH